jgi:hypothetical protein
VLPRYLTVPAVALTVPAGYAVTGFARLPHGQLRTWWLRGLGVAVLLGALFVAIKAPVVGKLRGELRFIRSTHDALVAILHEPVVERGRRCGPITFPNYRLVPDTRWILDASGREVGARSAKRRNYGVAMFFVDHKTLVRFGYSAGASRSTNIPDPGYRQVARNVHYRAYVACPGRA